MRGEKKNKKECACVCVVVVVVCLTHSLSHTHTNKLFFKKTQTKLHKKHLRSTFLFFFFFAVKHLFAKQPFKIQIYLKNHNIISTLNNGYLGFRNDEERSKLRYLV